MSTQGLPQDILDLQAALDAETTTEGAAIALLNSLAAQLTAALASGNPVNAVETIVTSMKANSAALAAAVAADTPAPPAPPAPAS